MTSKPAAAQLRELAQLCRVRDPMDREYAQPLDKATFNRLGGMCPRCEGMGSITDFDLTALYDDSLSLNDGALTIPDYSMDGWFGRIFRGCGFFDPDKPIRKYNKKELHDLLYKEPTKIKIDCSMQISDLAGWVRGLEEPSVAPLLTGLSWNFKHVVNLP